MFEKIKALFTGSSESTSSPSAPAVEYKGFRIIPTPKNVTNGWSTEAQIEKETDGETQNHHFIRADISSGKEGAADLAISKAKVMIDQQGDGIFR